MDSLFTVSAIVFSRGGEKDMSLKPKNNYIKFLLTFSLVFVGIADIVSRSTSIFLWGEIECPESLLK